MTILKSLMTQFIIAAAFMVALVLLLALSHNQSAQLQKSLTAWQADTDKLRLDIANLQQQAQHYKLNAPRDFDSYNRDVAVFYQQFRQQLTTLEQGIRHSNERIKQLSQSWLFDYITRQNSPLLSAIQQQSRWHSFWNNFISQLNQQLGNPDEPRLEWAAEFIISNDTQLSQQSNALAGQIQQANSRFSARAGQLNDLLIGLLAVYLLLSAVLFFIKVLRPVMATTRACEAVAAGEYGKKIPLSGSGESRRLQQAFNQLSARARLIIDMLGDVNQPGNVSDKLQRIYNSGHEVLGCNWIGLIAIDDQAATLHSSVPQHADLNFRHRRISLLKTFGRELNETQTSGWLNIRSLRQFSLNRHDERFLRELYKNTLATQVLGYPFRCPQQHHFILLFASNQADGFSRQQRELIQALSRLMADAIIAGMEQDKHPQESASMRIPGLI